MKRTVITAILAASMAIGITCTAGASDGEFKVSFICPNVALSYWSDVKEGLDSAAEEFGVELDFVGPSKIDTQQQIQMMEAAIANKADGIIVASLDANAFIPVIDRAVEEGIPVICLDADSPDSKRSSFIGTENTAAGQVLGQALVDAMDGQANVGIITGALDSENVNQRVDGVEAAFEGNDGMNILAVEAANTDLGQATQKAQAMMQAYPEMDAMLGTTSNDMIGAAQAIKEQGRTGEILLIGFDDLEQTLDLIRNGEIYGTVAQRPVNGGYLAVQYMVDLLNGKEIPERVDTGCVLVTKDNVDTYKTGE
ncbi:MAG: sugar-binding protein [Eubacteriales bacterium]|nr:sugar-binding protein [Eubacteriales bacterium]